MDKYFQLKNKIVFYVPSTKNGNTAISKKAYKTRQEEIARIFCSWFGGATTQAGQGLYLMQDQNHNNLVSETITQVISFSTDEAIEQNKINLIKLASEKRKDWTQETIGLEINGIFYLID